MRRLLFLCPNCVKTHKSCENAPGKAYKRPTTPETPDIKTAWGKEGKYGIFKGDFRG